MQMQQSTSRSAAEGLLLKELVVTPETCIIQPGPRALT
jgi:hypothetical protein